MKRVPLLTYLTLFILSLGPIASPVHAVDADLQPLGTVQLEVPASEDVATYAFELPPSIRLGLTDRLEWSVSATSTNTSGDSFAVGVSPQIQAKGRQAQFTVRPSVAGVLTLDFLAKLPGGERAAYRATTTFAPSPNRPRLIPLPEGFKIELDVVQPGNDMRTTIGARFSWADTEEVGSLWLESISLEMPNSNVGNNWRRDVRRDEWEYFDITALDYAIGRVEGSLVFKWREYSEGRETYVSVERVLKLPALNFKPLPISNQYPTQNTFSQGFDCPAVPKSVRTTCEFAISSYLTEPISLALQVRSDKKAWKTVWKTTRVLGSKESTRFKITFTDPAHKDSFDIRLIGSANGATITLNEAGFVTVYSPASLSVTGPARIRAGQSYPATIRIAGGGTFKCSISKGYYSPTSLFQDTYSVGTYSLKAGSHSFRLPTAERPNNSIIVKAKCGEKTASKVFFLAP